MHARRALQKDVKHCVAMGEIFHSQTHFKNIFPYSAPACISYLNRMTYSPSSFLLVVVNDDLEVVGMGGGLIGSVIFSDKPVASEAFFYIQPEWRGKAGSILLKGLEYEAQRRNCAAWIMRSLPNEDEARMKHYYLRKGYIMHESSFIKDLS